MRPTLPTSHFGETSNIQAKVCVPTSPGVIVLTSSLRVVYITHEAKELFRICPGGPDDKSEKTQIPPLIVEVCIELLARLKQCRSLKDWGDIQVRRTTSNRLGSLLLRAFGIPDFERHGTKRLLVLLESLHGGALPSSADQLLGGYHLTERQEVIARGLTRGLTNKELANELHLSEHTVKEHLKVVMLKFRVTTRAGAVAKFLGMTWGEKDVTSSSIQQVNPTVRQLV